ncbi:hypothetical protein LUX57_50585 [Actinomadura madurae]|nr:hypothetical protein [Actinomadura madurae]MCP9972323.1 hypothetical protein [Actinomadura madurae]
MQDAAFQDGHEAVTVLEDADVVQGVAVDEHQVGEEPFPHQAEFVAHAHHLAAVQGGGPQGLCGSEAEPLDEQLQVMGIAADRVPGESIVPARDDAHTAPDEFRDDLPDRFLGELDLHPGLGFGAGVVEVGVDDPGGGGDEHPLARVPEQVKGLFVGEGAVVDGADAVPDRHLDRLCRVGVRGQRHAVLAGRRRCRGDLLVGELHDP